MSPYLDSTRRNWLPFRAGEHGLDVSNTCHEALPIDSAPVEQYPWGETMLVLNRRLRRRAWLEKTVRWMPMLSLCLVGISGCDGDDAADNTPVDINYEARDVGGRGGGGMMQMNVDSMVVTADAASSALDLGAGGSAGMEETSDLGGLVDAGDAGTAGQGGEAGTGGMAGMGGNAGMMEDPAPRCPPNGGDCREACRFLSDCAVAGGCDLNATDRPLVPSCEQTREQSFAVD